MLNCDKMELKTVVLFLILNQLTLVIRSQEIIDNNVSDTGDVVNRIEEVLEENIVVEEGLDDDNGSGDTDVVCDTGLEYISN